MRRCCRARWIERMTDAPHTEAPDPAASLGQQLADIIERLPPDALSLGELLDVFSDEGLLLLTILLTLVFLPALYVAWFRIDEPGAEPVAPAPRPVATTGLPLPATG